MKSFLYIKLKQFLFDINGTDLFDLICSSAEAHPISVYLLGSKPDVINKACLNIQKKYPGLSIKGCSHGYFNLEEEAGIVDKINKSGAKLLICGMGMKKEWDFAVRKRDSIESRVVWNVGGLFDFVSGEKRRAPKLIRRLRLEWFFRFLLDPKGKSIRIFYLPFWSIYHFIIKIKIKKAIK
jgi:N-acetylglucosaminyldiphosphoundecaprenol N-acetyl-beta-D-mannosaminyltransferase